jgi:hypothetical protein
MIVPSAIVNITKVVLDITTEYSGSFYRDTSRYYVRQNTIGLKAIGIFY